MAEQEHKATDESRNQGRHWLLLPLVVIPAIGLWLWLRPSDPSPAHASDISPVRSTLHLETFVLNVQSNRGAAYLRAGIDLGINQEAKRAQEAVPIAEIRDTILDVLGEANADDLLTVAGKTKLKHDLLHSLQSRVPELGVVQVYFTEFLVQR